MPLVQMVGVEGPHLRLAADPGCSPTTKRAMGLVVDEIIDIVEERPQHRGGGPRNRGILGSAVIKGQATEVIDVGHFLPMAFADWFTRKEMKPSALSQSILLVDDSAFFRNMAGPGAQSRRLPRPPPRRTPRKALTAAALGPGPSTSCLTDIEMPDMKRF